MAKSILLQKDTIVVEWGSKRYEDLISNFALDYKHTLPVLPADATEWVYYPGQSSVQWNDNVANRRPLPWKEGDDILAAIDDILAAQNARKAKEIPDPSVLSLPLNDYKVEGKRIVDEITEITRTRFVTGGSTQVMIYQEKSDEAADYVAANYPPMGNPPEYPFLHADSVAYNITHQEAADQILLQRAKWVAAGARIEQIRLAAKNAISQATSNNQINHLIETTTKKLESL